MFLSVVVPAFNEEKGISEVLSRILRTREQILLANEVEAMEVIVVNDGSRDRTSEILSQFQGVKQIVHQTNQGYGAALKTGFKESSGEIIVFFDADGTYPPEFISDLVVAFQEAKPDILIGSRIKKGRKGLPLLRYVGNRFYAILLSWLSGRQVSDTASGMRMFRKDILREISPLPDGLNFTPAMSAKALFEGLKIMEIPMPYEERIGHSKLSIVRDGVMFLWTILSIAFKYFPVRVMVTVTVPVITLCIILFLLWIFKSMN